MHCKRSRCCVVSAWIVFYLHNACMLVAAILATEGIFVKAVLPLVGMWSAVASEGISALRLFGIWVTGVGTDTDAKEVFLFCLLVALGQGWQVLLFTTLRPRPAVPPRSLRVSCMFASFVSCKGRGMVSGEGTVRASEALCRRACFFVNHFHTPATDVYPQPDAGWQQGLLTTSLLAHGDKSPKTQTHKSVNV